MITAVDTNILLDLLIPGAPEGDRSERALGEAAASGAVIVSEPVSAEIAGAFGDRESLQRFLLRTGTVLEPSSSDALYRAGQAWQEYNRRRRLGTVCRRCGAEQHLLCAACGSPMGIRQHLVADFLIGAHAEVHANRILSRDRGFFSTYFPTLTIASR